MRSGTLLHRSLLLRQFPIIDIKAASMLQAKPARLSAYYIQDHSSTLAGCSQYFSMFPNSDSLSLSLAGAAWNFSSVLTQGKEQNIQHGVD